MDELIEPASANLVQTEAKDDPLVGTWLDRIKAGEKHWEKFHKRVRHNRKLVRGIDDSVDANNPRYNKQRANLIQSTLAVVLSKVYAKNPEMSAAPVNKGADLGLLCDTISTVTQVMLEDADLKQSGKRLVRAAMTCSFGIVKLQYQRDIRTDPVIVKRIEDSQDNARNIESLLAQVEDEGQRGDMESKLRELEQAIASMEAQKEVVAAEGLVLDIVRTDRLIIDPAIEDIWDYQASEWMCEKIPMRKSKAMGLFKESEIDFSSATSFKVGEIDTTANSGMYSLKPLNGNEDPIILIYELWNKTDNTIYTMVDGIRSKFARSPYQPQYAGERWWPYFLLPFTSVDGVFAAQSLADMLERLQEEHNETRDKFAEVRKNIRPHKIVSADVKDKDIRVRLHPEIGEIITVDTQGNALKDVVQEGVQLRIDPAVYDTSPISYDWEQVSGLQEAARSVVTTPKTATEASISDQALSARVADFRDQIEDLLTEISQCAAELCLLAMTPQQVEQIMGSPKQPDPMEMQQAMMTGQIPPPPEQTFEWPDQRNPESVFNLIQMKIRAGSTAAPNKLAMQEVWTKAMPLLQNLIGIIMQIEANGGDGTPYRELAKETAARFDETLDVERFLPVKPQIPGPAGMPAPGGLPGQQPLQQP